ncbi:MULTISPECIES: hypothetical protein [Pseudomonas]|uniref:hypothetical protein n=1 Tax=Pseudomonas TaxID=286 RepID=UPI0010C031C4|nr:MULTISPECIES: hypothetical protein [Pseudomonas]
MEADLQKLISEVNVLEEQVDHLKSFLGSKPLNKTMREAFVGFEQNLEQFSRGFEADELDKIVGSASALGIYGEAIGQRVASLNDPNVNNICPSLVEQAIKLRKLADEGPLAMRPLGESRRPELVPNFMVAGKASQSNQAWSAAQTKKQLDEYAYRLADLEQKLRGLENTASTEIDKVTQAYADAQADIKAKTDDINRVTGQAAARMIAGDYEGSAAVEKETADYLRYGALACMLLIIGVLGWAVLESNSATFEWDRFLSKVSLVFLLGVPATYLARESAKHREQQYHHLQTSLDMKAISPFLASLPEEAQHKLKADIASRIFGGRDFSKVSNDPYPLNTHEIIMKLIDKVDFSNKPDKAPATPDKASKKTAEGASAAPAESANQ